MASDEAAVDKDSTLLMEETEQMIPEDDIEDENLQESREETASENSESDLVEMEDDLNETGGDMDDTDVSDPAMEVEIMTAYLADSGIKTWYVSSYTDFFWAWIDICINNSGTGQIVLLADVAKGDDNWDTDNMWIVGSGMNIAINLNGHTLSNHCGRFYDYAKSSMFYINGGTLSIYSSAGTGTVDGRSLCYVSCGTNECGALIDLNSGTLRLGYSITGARQSGSLQIGNTANLMSYGSQDPEGGTIVNVWGGTLYAYNTKFINADGTALWGCNYKYGCGTSVTYLTQCSSQSVSGLWSSGDWSRSSSKIIIDGGTYRIGRKYTAGIECFRLSTGSRITNCTFVAGSITASQSGDVYVDHVTMSGGGINLTSSRNCTVKNTTCKDTGAWYKVVVSPTSSGVVTTLENVYCSLGLYGIGVAAGTCQIKSSTVESNLLGGISVSGGTVNISNSAAKKQVYESRAKGIDITGGTVNISGTELSGNDYGLSVTGGTAAISGGNIKSNTTGIYNNSTMSLTSNQVIINSNNLGIYNDTSGKLTITGMDCGSNRTYGLYNVSAQAVLYSGGLASGNSTYDIYQGGKSFTMNGGATASGNGIFLVKGCTVKISTALTGADSRIRLTLADNNIAPGTICIENNTTSATAAMLKKFSLVNTYTSTVTSQVMRNGVKRRVAVLRPGNGSNGGNTRQGVLSEEYYVSFEGNITNAHLTFQLPEQRTIYWKEANTASAGAATALYDGVTLKSLVHRGWNSKKDGTGTGYEINAVLRYTAAESTKDYIYYTVWRGDGNLLINGNQQTTGDNYTMYAFISNESVLPENSFSKVGSYQSQQKDGLTWEITEVTEELPYSFQGWSLSSTATYADAGVYQPGNKLDLTSEIINELKAGKEQISDNGYLSVVCYVVWDEFPIIEAQDRYFTKSQVRQGALTAEELLRTATGSDRENSQALTMDLLEFAPEDFADFSGDLSYGTITYRCRDAVNNVSYRSVHVYVTENGIFQGNYTEDNLRYTRFINRSCYLTRKESQGGLMDNSVWYEEADYCSTLQQAFDRIDAGSYVMRYTFDRDVIIQSQQYVQAHGPGNYSSENNLENYAALISGCLSR
jgi:hypothetical protein